MKELDLYKPLIQAQMFKYDIFAREVPVADYLQSRKRIDIVLLDSRKTLTAIEVKIRDWKSAIRQAFTNLFASDFSYVALWHDYADNVDLDLLAKTGIGLISINRNSCVIIERANKSRFTISRKHYYLMTHCIELKRHNEPRLIHTPKPHSREQMDRGIQNPILYCHSARSHP